MPNSLRELIRSSGKTQATCGITQAGASYINTGKHRASPSSIDLIAAALAATVAEVQAACDESWRRAHPDASAAVGPGTDGQSGAAHD